MGFNGYGCILYAKIVTGDNIGVFEWLKFLVGYNSYLYYLTVLMICYLIYFYPVKHNKITIMAIVSIFITIISQQLTAWGILDVKSIGLTNYLNIFNWVGYFSLGLCLKNVDAYKFITKIRKYIVPIIMIWVALFVIAYYFDNSTGYFSLFAIPLQIFGAIIVFALSSFKSLDCRFVKYIARISFSVYLVHMVIIALVYKFIGNLYCINLFVPIVTLLLIAGLIFAGEKIAQKIKLESVYYKLLGIRRERKA